MLVEVFAKLYCKYWPIGSVQARLQVGAPPPVMPRKYRLDQVMHSPGATDVQRRNGDAVSSTVNGTGNGAAVDATMASLSLHDGSMQRDGHGQFQRA